ncbi:unnamed protein product [Clonostachys solani]|uniref:Major facilitator superfamily (MFS) profile domain-containing protein n=1 Tax=Clonostachys solani TaxID=160281 RepID=A0A9N9Z090_9HYPO|nr:unnamed protein product [Clonostachys solani]
MTVRNVETRDEEESPPTSPSPTSEPPDGGVQAWTQVAMGWIVMVISWGWVNSFGGFQAYYIDELPESPSTISWIGSVQAWLTFSTGAFSGRLLDAGFFTPALLVGAVLQLVGIFLTSISTKYWQLLLTQGILTGFGGGILFTPSVGLVLTYFSSRRAIALGIITTGNSIGGLAYPILVRGLLPRLGFAWTMRLIGFVHMVGFALVACLMRSRLPPRKAGPIIDWVAFKESVFLSYNAGLFFFNWAMYYTFYHIGAFGIQVLGMPYSEAAYLVTIVNGVGVPARLVIPLLAGRYGPLNMMIIMGSCVTVMAFCWLATSDRVGMYVWAAIYGLFSGGFQSLIPTGLASITKSLDMVGTRLGMFFTVISFAALTGPPIGGAIQTAEHGGYRVAEIWAALATFLCTVFVAITRVRKVGWKIGTPA